MLQILPSTLQFEEAKSKITIENPTDAAFVGRLRCSNATAYTFDRNDFRVTARQKLELPISIQIGRQVEDRDVFRVQYYLDEAVKPFAFYQEAKAPAKEAQIRVILKRHVNVRREYDGLSTQQQLIQAEETIQKLSEERIKLCQRLTNAKKQTQLSAKQRKVAEQKIAELEKEIANKQAGFVKFNLGYGILAAVVFAVSFLVVYSL